LSYQYNTIFMFEFDNLKSYPELEPIQLHDYFKEQLVLFYYNLTRKSSDVEIHKMSSILHNLLSSLKTQINIDQSYIVYLKLLYKMMGETRDCFYGKGEQELTYMMIFVLYKYYPVLSIYLLHKLVQPLNNCCFGKLGFGSWRDIKYFCDYVRIHSMKGDKDVLIEICVELINNRLKKDIDILSSRKYSTSDNIRDHISSVAKWIPRENKKFDWLNDLLIIHWYNTYHPYMFKHVKGYVEYYNALDKCKM